MPADKILLHIDVLNAFSLDFPLYCKDHVMQILSCNHFCLCLNLLVQFQTSRDWTLPCLFYICIKPAYCTKIVKWTEWIFDFLLLILIVLFEKCLHYLPRRQISSFCTIFSSQSNCFFSVFLPTSESLLPPIAVVLLHASLIPLIIQPSGFSAV